MRPAPHILLVEPTHYDVSYVINPWMRPAEWAADPERHRGKARAAFHALAAALRDAGAIVDTIPGVPGLPDMVFPANAAIVLDRHALVARFARAERQGEEPCWHEALRGLAERGVLETVETFPDGVFQEGAGDCIWDRARHLFWAGHGQRSTLDAIATIERHFGQEVVPLELATPRFYHLDTCFCPLAGGEVLFYPPAFSEESLARIHARVPPSQRLEASEADAAAFCVNAVNLDRQVVLARAPQHVRDLLTVHGYTVREVDLAPFILSGGGAYCMTLRLDRASGT